MSTLAPFGFQAGQSRRSVNEYYVPASDTSAYAVGDPVKTNGNVFVGRLPDSRQSNGMLHVGKAASGNAVRGVVVGVVAGPGDNSAQSVPAVKQRAYTLLVNDNPQALWDVQANNTAALSAMGGMYASYTVGGPLGSVSSTVVDASSIGTDVGDLLIAEVLTNTGANSLLRVAFVQHEMAAAGGSPQIGASIQSLVSGAGISADGVALYDATTIASATCTVGSATASFSAADIGKPCVVLPYTNTVPTPRYGTITAVASPTSCTAALSGSPGALTGATFIYGSDQGGAIDAALAVASAGASKGMLWLPNGIICTTRQHILPTGVYLRGFGNNSSGGKAKDFKHYGTSLVLVSYYAASPFLTLGSISSADPRGTALEYLNVDCCNLTGTCIGASASGRTNRLYAITAVRGNGGQTYDSGPTDRVSHCHFINQNSSNVVSLSGDTNFGPNNVVTGAGNGFYGVKASNGDDITIHGNHIWKDSADTTMLGGAIWLSFNSGNTTAGSVSVLGNKCDTNYGSAIKISVSGSSSARSISIANNHCFNNASVANNTGPVIELNVGAGSDIRGLTIGGNHARASFSGTGVGQWTYLIDNGASAGTIYGSWAGGNVGHGVNALYNAFVPTMDAGNLVMVGAGTAVTKSTIA